MEENGTEENEKDGRGLWTYEAKWEKGKKNRICSKDGRISKVEVHLEPKVLSTEEDDLQRKGKKRGGFTVDW